MNENSENIYHTISILKKHYWGNVSFLLALFVLAILELLPFFIMEQPISVALERYAIMITIITVPLSLKYFAQRIKKNKYYLDKTKIIKTYKNASHIRLYTISLTTLALIILYDYSRNMNFFWLIIILFVIFVFCMPSHHELEVMIEDGTNKISQETEKLNEE